MTARTVTFAVQLGSGGFEVAHRVADALKYRYYDWEVTSQAAAQAGVSPETIAAAEHAPSFLERIVERLLAPGLYDDEAMGRLSVETMSSAIRTLSSGQYRQLIESVVKELSERGEAVVVGHAGQIVLRDTPGVAKVLVCGSPARRAARLVVDEGLTLEAATAAVRDSDKQRNAFFKQTYNVDLLSASLYDLALNTDQVGVDAAVDLVLAVADRVTGFVPEAEGEAAGRED